MNKKYIENQELEDPNIDKVQTEQLDDEDL